MEFDIESTLQRALQVRYFEERLLEEYKKGQIHGTVHTCIGQEVFPCILSEYTKDYHWFSNHRGHGHYLAKTKDFKGLAAEILLKEGINAEVIDLRTLKPLDKDTIINSVKKTSKCVVVEQGWSQSGIGSEITAILMEEAFDYLDAPVLRVTGKDVPMPYAENLEKLALPTVEDILDIVKKII